MTSAADRRGRSGGFTLIEMVVVLTILAIAVGLVVPLFGARGSGAELNAAAARLRAAMAEARAVAIAEGRLISVRGDVAGGFWLDGRHRPLDDEDRRLRVLTAGGAAISFFPSGSSSGGRVVVQGPYARRELTVDAVTGRAVLLP